jgi:inhibitor of cysteine peptidase
MIRRVLSTVLLVFAASAMLASSAGAQQAVPQVEPPWSGALPPAAGGSAILTVTRDTATSDLVARLREEGCNVRSVAITEAGAWSIYIPGAPSVVNQAFPADLVVSRGFIVRCADPGSPFQLVEQDAGTRLRLDVGDTVRVTLPANPTTGFSWRAEPEPANSVLAPIGDPTFTPDSPALGAGGLMSLEFLATGPGMVDLHLVYDRVFETVPPEQEWQVTVEVVGVQPVAWLGTISEPTAGAPQFELAAIGNEATAVFAIDGSDGATSNAISSFVTSGDEVLVWGELVCDSSGADCTIHATTLLSALSTSMPAATAVVGWTGTIQSLPAGAQFDDYFTLSGTVPVQYGIAGATPDVEAQLAELRDSGQRIRISGELQALVPDVHLVQIAVTEVGLAP